jgi:hypothetical protein
MRNVLERCLPDRTRTASGFEDRWSGLRGGTRRGLGGCGALEPGEPVALRLRLGVESGCIRFLCGAAG